ncbi:hypothetical protein ROZALSC1DRAFT_24322, partial [Rozella allomycis CSF55]
DASNSASTFKISLTSSVSKVKKNKSLQGTSKSLSKGISKPKHSKSSKSILSYFKKSTKSKQEEVEDLIEIVWDGNNSQEKIPSSYYINNLHEDQNNSAEKFQSSDSNPNSISFKNILENVHLPVVRKKGNNSLEPTPSFIDPDIDRDSHPVFICNDQSVSKECEIRMRKSLPQNTKDPHYVSACFQADTNESTLLHANLLPFFGKKGKDSGLSLFQKQDIHLTSPSKSAALSKFIVSNKNTLPAFEKEGNNSELSFSPQNKSMVHSKVLNQFNINSNIVINNPYLDWEASLTSGIASENKVEFGNYPNKTLIHKKPKFNKVIKLKEDILFKMDGKLLPDFHPISSVPFEPPSDVILPSLESKSAYLSLLKKGNNSSLLKSSSKSITSKSIFSIDSNSSMFKHPDEFKNGQEKSKDLWDNYDFHPVSAVSTILSKIYIHLNFKCAHKLLRIFKKGNNSSDRSPIDIYEGNEHFSTSWPSSTRIPRPKSSTVKRYPNSNLSNSMPSKLNNIKYLQLKRSSIDASKNLKNRMEGDGIEISNSKSPLTKPTLITKHIKSNISFQFFDKFERGEGGEALGIEINREERWRPEVADGRMDLNKSTIECANNDWNKMEIETNRTVEESESVKHKGEFKFNNDNVIANTKDTNKDAEGWVNRRHIQKNNSAGRDEGVLEELNLNFFKNKIEIEDMLEMENEMKEEGMNKNIEDDCIERNKTILNNDKDIIKDEEGGENKMETDCLIGIVKYSDEGRVELGTQYKLAVDGLVIITESDIHVDNLEVNIADFKKNDKNKNDCGKGRVKRNVKDDIESEVLGVKNRALIGNNRKIRMGPESNQIKTKAEEGGVKEQGEVAERIEYMLTNLDKAIVENDEGGVDILMGLKTYHDKKEVEEGGVKKPGGVVERDLDIMKKDDDEGGVDVLMGPEFNHIETAQGEGGVKEEGGEVEMIKLDLNNFDDVILEDGEGGVEMKMQFDLCDLKATGVNDEMSINDKFKNGNDNDQCGEG